MKAKFYDDEDKLEFECDIPSSLAVFIRENFITQSFTQSAIDGGGEPGSGPDDDPPND